MTSSIKGCLFGLAIGDALGVPAEFKSRADLLKRPISDYIGFGSHSQQPGTFSDDTSMSFCLVEALIEGYSLDNLTKKFIDWKQNGYWTARGFAFDWGITTGQVIDKLKDGHSPLHSGLKTEGSNGNGSIMRILPLAFFIRNLTRSERYQWIQQISGITHAHSRSVYACVYLIEFALLLLSGETKERAFTQMSTIFSEFISTLATDTKELEYFERLLDTDFPQTHIDAINSSGYVIDSLEASIWSFLNSNSYESAVLSAVNLGEDTDTIGSITGALAGLYYGFDALPSKWVAELARTEDVKDLVERFVKS